VTFNGKHKGGAAASAAVDALRLSQLTYDAIQSSSPRPHFGLALGARHWHFRRRRVQTSIRGCRSWLKKAGASLLETLKGRLPGAAGSV